MIDYHTHTWRCRHAEGEVDDYVRSGIERGLKEIGMSDHFPMDLLGFPPEDICSMPAGEISSYAREVQQARITYHGQISVRMGIEVDYVPGGEKAITSLLDMEDWDYTIGSVHFLNNTDVTHAKNVDYFSDRSIMDIYSDYFDLVRDMVISGIFSVIGHVDVVKKHGHVPDAASTAALHELYIELARLFARCDQVVEVNTAGLRAPVGEMYPAPALLGELVRWDVPVTIGSDAHAPHEVGCRVGEVVDLLKTLGMEKVVGFSSGKPHEIPL